MRKWLIGVAALAAAIGLPAIGLASTAQSTSERTPRARLADCHRL
jgi:hypothetical protein